MKSKAGLVGAVLLVIIVLAVILAVVWQASEVELTIRPDDVTLSWISEKSLVTQCSARNDTDKDWEGMVSLEVRNLDGETLCDYTTDSWLDKEVKSGEKTTVTMKIPFDEINGRYTEDTVILRYSWGTQTVEKEFRI